VALTKQNVPGVSTCGSRRRRCFAQGRSAVEVAGLLEVSTKSAYQGRRAWVTGGVTV
jgi:hypothetical protein